MTVQSSLYNTTENSFEKFLSYTNEKEILGAAVQAELKPSYKKLLDVGAGNGDLTRHIIDSFQRVVLLEPAEVLYKQLQTRFPQAQIVNATLEDFSLTENFDFILASHVFIYISHIDQAITKLFSNLNQEGKIVIIMLDNESPYLKFITHFTPEVSQQKSSALLPQWSDIVSTLTTYAIRHTIKDVTSHINCPSLQHFLDINDFHFNQDVSSISESLLQKMREFLPKPNANRTFSLEVGHKLIIIERR